MAQSKIRKGASQGPRSGFSFRRHLRKEWKAPVFVAACVTIAHLGFNSFDAIDSYAFLALGNRLSSATEVTAEAPKPDPDSVVVVRIDEQAFLRRYRERSPLDRCALSSQLSAIYAAAPEILVIDLDLSPAVEGDPHCQDELHATLKQGVMKTRTVVMEPFDSFDPDVTKSRGQWRREREGDGVRFGDAALPVSYGMALHYYTGNRTLYAAARRTHQHAAIADDASPPSLDQRRIDVRAYMANLLPVLTSWTDAPEKGAKRDQDLTDTLLAYWSTPLEDKVVFFGAGFGQEDAYLTPVGKLYGVEIHAAAFWSGQPRSLASLLASSAIHLGAFALDIVFAFAFGTIIAYCWTHYFAWRSDEHSTYEQLAPIWVAIMLLGLLAAIAASAGFSYWLLRFGLWLSPIPLAVGMLIDGCMAGSVEAAVHRLHLVRSESGARPPARDAVTKRLMAGKKTIWRLTLGWALVLVITH